MKTSVPLFAATAAFALMTASAAFAQMSPDPTPATPSGNSQPGLVNPPGSTPNPNIAAVGLAGEANGAASATVPMSSSALGDTSQLKAGDPGVVSNAPVPDTPENRAKYGKPESNRGKHSAAHGD